MSSINEIMCLDGYAVQAMQLENSQHDFLPPPFIPFLSSIVLPSSSFHSLLHLYFVPLLLHFVSLSLFFCVFHANGESCYFFLFILLNSN